MKKNIIDLRAKKISETPEPSQSEPLIFHDPPVIQQAVPHHTVLVEHKTAFIQKESNTHTARTSRSMLWGVGSGIACVGGIILVLSTVFAHITLNLKPKIENLELQSVGMILDMNANQILSAQKTVPAERLEFIKDEHKEFAATGQHVVEDKAHGKVKIYNSFSSSSQTLVSGTRFATDTGRVYRLSKTVIVPGAKIDQGKINPQFIETDLVADGAGEEYNNANEIRLTIPGLKGTPKYTGFYGIASQGFDGGFKGTAKVISKDDLTRAQTELTKTVYDEALADLIKKTPPHLKLVDAFRDIEILKVDSPKENTRADTFTIAASAQVRALLFREEDIVSLLHDILLKDDATHEFIDGSADITYQLHTADFDKGRAEITLQGTIKTKSVISPNAVAMLVQGKKEGSIVDALKQQNDIGDFRIYFFPPWLFSAPSDANKIRVDVQNPQ